MSDEVRRDLSFVFYIAVSVWLLWVAFGGAV
jgi:hypothetical protein